MKTYLSKTRAPEQNKQAFPISTRTGELQITLNPGIISHTAFIFKSLLDVVEFEKNQWIRLIPFRVVFSKGFKSLIASTLGYKPTWALWNKV